MPAPVSTPPHRTAPPPRPATFSSAPRKAYGGVKFMDRFAGGVIRFGGVLVILAVAAIFVFVGREALPLFLSAKSKPVFDKFASELVADARPGFLGMDEYETYAYWLHPTGAIHLAALDDQKARPSIPLPQLQRHPLSAAYRSPSKDHLYLGTRDGFVLLGQLKFTPAYTESGRTVTAKFSEEKLIQ